MTYVNNIVFEKVNDNFIRMVIFEKDDLGMSVFDIYEIKNDVAYMRFLANKCHSQVEFSEYDDVEISFHVNGENKTLDEFDTGRARLVSSKVMKVLQEYL